MMASKTFYRCQGLPNGFCPNNRQDATVRNTIYDLFLCLSCEEARHQMEQQTLNAEKNNKKDKQEKQTKKSSKNIGKHEHAATAATTAAERRVAVTQNIVVNELLTYTSYYMHKSNADALRKITLSVFTPTEISKAKQILIDTFQSASIPSTFTADRRSSSTRLFHEAEIDDILGILQTVDTADLLKTVIFAAANLEIMPRYGPEEINIAAVVEGQTRVEATIKNMSNAITQLTTNAHASANDPTDVNLAITDVQSRMNNIQLKLDSFVSSINNRLDQLQTVCQSSLKPLIQHQISEHHEEIDRKSNIIIFGVPEDREISVWRRNVDDILQFVCGRPVDVSDISRLGRYTNDKVRPIRVKLRTFWDKRLLLSNCYKLKNYTSRGIFIASDEPLEVRRRQTFDRLKYRAQRENKQVDVIENTLSIEGIAVFSSTEGFINNNHNGGHQQ